MARIIGVNLPRFVVTLRPAMAKKLTQIADSLMDSYRKHGGINHLDGANLPSREAVVEITQDLLRLLFPGFYDKEPLHSAQIAKYTSELMSSVAKRLETEIYKSLEYRPYDKCDKKDMAGTAARVTEDFLQELPAVRTLLQTDVVAAYEGDPAAISNEEVILAYPGIEAIAVQRMAHLLYQRHVAIIPRIMTEWAHSKTGIDIHPGAQIGPSFFIDHGTGVVFGETTIIGQRVKIYQGVGLVAKSLAAGQALRGQKRHPTIEDRVTIYAGATILGNVTIGHDSIIGGNVWLLESVPPDTVVYQEGGKTQIRSAKGKALNKMMGHFVDGAGI